ncbi:MAG: D-threonate 4-phosphate dehydrogenase [bacterium]|nr:D-threonate 4-phosphate dehydrogenase [bacterium]
MEQDLTTGKPLLVITQGDPAGIGPEICLKALSDPAVLEVCRPVLAGDVRVLEQVGHSLGLKVPEIRIPRDSLDSSASLFEGEGPFILGCGHIDEELRPGEATRLAGEASYRYITTAIEGAMQGIFDGTVTAPITKTTLHLAGITEPGHTEIFARLTGTRNYAMMLYSPRIAVSFVTCHQSLRSVPDSFTTEDVIRVTSLTHDTLLRIRGKQPRIAVLGLNPHAGEKGLFGDEESRLIEPAVEHCRAHGWLVEGPIPPDAAFMPHALARFDGHVTLYHDQGSIPFKMISMHDGVNITMGLPIIRTSVDHGTAYDIAWQGKASHSSLVSAIQLAAQLASSRQGEGESL